MSNSSQTKTENDIESNDLHENIMYVIGWDFSTNSETRIEVDF